MASIPKEMQELCFQFEDLFDDDELESGEFELTKSQRVAANQVAENIAMSLRGHDFAVTAKVLTSLVGSMLWSIKERDVRTATHIAFVKGVMSEVNMRFEDALHHVDKGHIDLRL